MKTVVIVLEGVDGCGKGKQTILLDQSLYDMGRSVCTTFEPWRVPRSPDGMRIDRILQHEEKEIDPGDGTVDPLKFQTMYFADRCVHWVKEIIPALSKGKDVVSDRERFSTYAYGFAFGIPVEEIHAWHQILPVPDLMVYLKCSADILIGRLTKRGQEQEYFERRDRLAEVVKAYNHISEMEILPNLVVVNGEPEPEIVHQDIMAHVEKLLEGGVKNDR